MNRWAWKVAGLYGALLLVLIVPGGWLAFAPGVKVGEAIKIYICWPYWLCVLLMVVSQFALLAVPVRVASLRPVTRGPIWRTILGGGLMAGALAAGAFLSICEFVMRNQGNWDRAGWVAIGLAILTWGIWALVFFRVSSKTEPTDFVSRQCRCLLKGSVLELLIAVPTHVVARSRNYCCAGFMTFIGLAMGVSVMLFAFGPSVFFLFVQRWKRLHPANPSSTVPPIDA
jgi:hypothetical protein